MKTSQKLTTEVKDTSSCAPSMVALSLAVAIGSCAEIISSNFSSHF